MTVRHTNTSRVITPAEKIVLGYWCTNCKEVVGSLSVLKSHHSPPSACQSITYMETGRVRNWLT